jgi:hypothetical protein
VLNTRALVGWHLGVGEVPVDLSEQPGSPQVQEAAIADDHLVLRGMLDDLVG